MPTVHRAEGMRFVIFVNDHWPAHVHAIKGSGEAKIALGQGEAAPRLAWARGMRAADIRQAMTEVAKERARLRAAWTAIHGESE
ncbi:MAG TPA: DUF4160 domain-containing protein [Caulobacteraceae bacterium]|nr:DUF4160 domain-containing protein [Caulobacteraceae bacterium]